MTILQQALTKSEEESKYRQYLFNTFAKKEAETTQQNDHLKEIITNQNQDRINLVFKHKQLRIN